MTHSSVKSLSWQVGFLSGIVGSMFSIYGIHFGFKLYLRIHINQEFTHIIMQTNTCSDRFKNYLAKYAC